MARARFITFEGGEGGGKSTQVARLAGKLRDTGRDVITTREPGGSPGAEAVRALLVTGAADRWSPTAEALLIYAARLDHVERVIAPALARGAIVVCDRFADSTRAYQGGETSASLIAALEAEVRARCWPDMTLILDLDPALGLARAQARAGTETRFEAKGLAFHEALRARFLAIAAAEPERCRVIDASQGEDRVATSVWRAVEERL